MDAAGVARPLSLDASSGVRELNRAWRAGRGVSDHAPGGLGVLLNVSCAYRTEGVVGGSCSSSSEEEGGPGRAGSPLGVDGVPGMALV